jgi:hypothetical protein
MSDATTLATVVGTATAINTVYAIQKNRDAAPVLVGSGILFGCLVLTGELTQKWQLAVALAWLFLIGSFFAHGVPAITSLASAASAKSK